MSILPHPCLRYRIHKLVGFFFFISRKNLDKGTSSTFTSTVSKISLLTPVVSRGRLLNSSDIRLTLNPYLKNHGEEEDENIVKQVQYVHRIGLEGR